MQSGKVSAFDIVPILPALLWLFGRLDHKLLRADQPVQVRPVHFQQPGGCGFVAAALFQRRDYGRVPFVRMAAAHL